ncbi:MAG: serine/threonine-protein kinase [Thermoplasmatota archaeon]
MPPEKELRELQRANQDLDMVLKRYRELSTKLNQLHQRHEALVLDDVSSPKHDRSRAIFELIKERRYQEAEKEMGRFEKEISTRESSREDIKAFGKRFQNTKLRWYGLVGEKKLKDDGSLVKVANAANNGDFISAGKQLDRMDRIMDEAEGRTALNYRAKENYDRLMRLGQELLDQGIAPSREIVEKDRIRSLIKDKRMGEANDLIKRKIDMLETMKSDHEGSKEIYERLSKKIDDFNEIGYLDPPVEFKEGLREFEAKNYGRAGKLFEKAESKIFSMIDRAEPRVDYRLDLRGSRMRMDRWEEGNLVLSNNGLLDIGSIEVETASQNYKLDVDAEDMELKSGSEAKVPIRLFMKEEGLVPIRMKMTFNDLRGKSGSQRKKKFKVRVDPALPRTKVDMGSIGASSSRDSLRRKVGEIYKVKEEKQLDLRSGDFYSYRMVGKLGAGGFSTVYRVESDGTQYALKTPKDIGIDGDETVEINKRELLKFKKEASIWAMLTDTIPDDVISLIDVGIEPFPWFVMELAEGSLRDELEGASLEKRIGITLNVLTKFDRVHHLGIVHRDIKPENILFIEEDPKVTDFGISKLVSSTSKSTLGMSGTCFYMSPEQISRSRFGSVDWRTDIWQLGVLIYEMLTDRLPFQADDPYEVTSNILHDEPLPISELSPGLEDLDEPLIRALHKDKKKRCQSALELKFSIEKALGI